MNETRFWESLTGRLFKFVFGSYLVLALVVTAVQLLIEYRITQRQIQTDLGALSLSFREGISRAAWDLDLALVGAMAKGIAQSSIVTGVAVVNEHGDALARVGHTPLVLDFADSPFWAPFQYSRSSLEFESVKGLRHLGTLVIYSDQSVALHRVLDSFYVILVNSIVKTLALWLIFYLAITRFLSQPLSRLAEVVSHIEFAAESHELMQVNYPHADELGRLLASMRTMQQRLFKAYAELARVNAHLEQTVTERTAHLTEALHWNEQILLNSPIAMGVYDAQGQCVMANEAYVQFVGSSHAELLGQNLFSIAAWRKTRMPADCLAALEEQKPRQGEAEAVAAFGQYVFFEYRILPIRLRGAQHVLIQFTDLLGRKRLEEELRQMAFHDALTHLPNRRLLLDRILQALRSGARDGSYLAVLFLDLNRFKQLNDNHGHAVGDLLLVEVARRLRQTLRGRDTVARIGGDEFVVLLEGLGPDPGQAREYANGVAAKIQSALNTDYVLGDIPYHSSASIGIAIVPGDAHLDPDALIDQADAAMYAVKRGRAPGLQA